ncbi:ABC transporter permease [Aminithiophilus ramosus]|uniref:ABC transporter permease n=2 Tax=Synergistales TaxID=649776 RepID=A0A9Q7A861_9BACT|nr:ABC transporter permease [Aminithiophilus ramosus]QTX32416.1 ABC transporter permease [Aminithiophilus ramosus]QVL36293.1 ABC transporter permease [Synergistota bacterium]
MVEKRQNWVAVGDEGRASAPASLGLAGGLLFPFAVLALWWGGSALGLWSPVLLPAPLAVGRAALRLARSGDLLRHIGASGLRILWGFGLSCFMALPLGVLLGLRPGLGRFVNGTLEFLRHVPPLALLPMLILWLGIGEASKSAVIVLATFFPVFLNTVDGVRRCDRGLLEVGLSLGLSEGERFRRIILPWALPSILTGLRLGLGYSWRALIGAELIAASSGLGYLIHDAQALSRSDVIVVAIIAMGLLGALTDDLFFRLARRLVPWRGEGRGGH